MLNTLSKRKYFGNVAYVLTYPWRYIGPHLFTFSKAEARHSCHPQIEMVLTIASRDVRPLYFVGTGPGMKSYPGNHNKATTRAFVPTHFNMFLAIGCFTP